jgi:signal transduction histidine kinase
MNPSHFENEGQSSFFLTKMNLQYNPRFDEDRKSTFIWQEHAYDRLKVLYGVGKLLSATDNLQTDFNKIISLCASTFPILTAVLIENRSKKLQTVVWNNSNVSAILVKSAVTNAKNVFIYLTGYSNKDLLADVFSFNQDEIKDQSRDRSIENKNYCVSPLIIDRLPAFGVLQFEASSPLNEQDLEFVEALTDLISITIDRLYRVEMAHDAEEAFRIREAEMITSKLQQSQENILNLESERELREKFVALLTHDLRTPLTAIKMSADLIQRQAGGMGSKAINFASRIAKNVKRADKMIGDLLDANCIRGGQQLPLQLELFDMSVLIAETLNELASICGDRFKLEVQAEMIGYWDPKGIRRIVENLCNNAVKYGYVDTPIRVSLSQSNKNVRIMVQNQGEIIPIEDQKFLFSQFRRGRKAVLGKNKGWGLGLALVRGVAEAHGGTVQLKSEFNIGTVFTISLPRDAR